MTLRLLGVVLCGGKSKRMGTDKSNLKHESGITFLQHSCDRLSRACDQVVLSGNQPESDYAVILDVVADHGPAAGVASALGYAREHQYDACFVTPVDMPSLSIDDLLTIKQVWLAHPDQTTCGISMDARLQPLVSIYPVTLLREITTLAHSNDRSLYRWIKNQPHVAVTLPNESCRNINRPEDVNP